jgi:hypothetical protein
VKTVEILLCCLLLSFDNVQEPSSRKTAVVVYAASAALDLGSTFVALRAGMVEDNIFARPFKTEATPVVVLGAAADVVGVKLWLRATKNRPTLSRVGLYVAAAVRVFYGVRNIVRYQKHPRCLTC